MFSHFQQLSFLDFRINISHNTFKNLYNHYWLYHSYELTTGHIVTCALPVIFVFDYTIFVTYFVLCEVYCRVIAASFELKV
jgi:hypothetical protein